MSGVSRTACWIRRLHSLTRSKFFSLFSGKRPSFGRLFFGGLFFCLRRWVVGLGLRWHPRLGFVARPVWFLWVFAGIRELLACFRRRPCAGRHLLFFAAAAKKSRQKKAANTANISPCLRAPTGSYASHGNHVTHVRCQRSCAAPHPLHAPALHHAVSDSRRRPGGKLCVGRSA